MTIAFEGPHEYNSLDLSYKVSLVTLYLSCYLKREQWLLRLPQPLNKLTFEQSKMLRLRTENMEVIIRLINSKESNPGSLLQDDDSKMLRMSFLKIVKGFLLQ